MNIEFEYQYHDADNNKAPGKEVIFTNDSNLSLGRLFAEIEKCLEDGQLFIADQIGIPEVFLWGPEADYDPDDESTYPADLGPGKYAIREDTDHCYHEFLGLSETEHEATDSRTITEFLAALRRASRVGWTQFLPTDRRSK